MRITLLCSRCIDENRDELAKFYSASVREDGLYRLTCERGHQSDLFLIDQKYVVLFEIALHAIIDGYYRDAVASATSSLERFYEFATRVMLHHAGVASPRIEDSWKIVSKRSEQQLGMFVAAHTFHFGHLPQILSATRVTERNQVIHNGEIPSEEKAKGYLAEISKIIGETIINLKETAASSLASIVSDSVKKVANVNFCTLPSHLSPTTSSAIFRNATIESRLEDIDARRAAVKSTNLKSRKSAIIANLPFE